MRRLAVGVALSAVAVALAPAARAESYGNYELGIADRRDFHTWVWAMSSCGGTPNSPPACVHVLALPRPIGKAFSYRGDARLADGRYTLAVDVPDGLRCGDIYYGPVIPTHDVYTWDATTLRGTLESSFATGCDGGPAGSYVYPFALTRF